PPRSPLSLHDALPIFLAGAALLSLVVRPAYGQHQGSWVLPPYPQTCPCPAPVPPSTPPPVAPPTAPAPTAPAPTVQPPTTTPPSDRKSTRLNSSHSQI